MNFIPLFKYIDLIGNILILPLAPVLLISEFLNNSIQGFHIIFSIILPVIFILYIYFIFYLIFKFVFKKENYKKLAITWTLVYLLISLPFVGIKFLMSRALGTEGPGGPIPCLVDNDNDPLTPCYKDK